MDHIGRWVANVIVGVIGLLGLYVASRATDNTFYAMGLIVFVLAVAFIFYSIRRAFDKASAGPRGPGDTSAHSHSL